MPYVGYILAPEGKLVDDMDLPLIMLAEAPHRNFVHVEVVYRWDVSDSRKKEERFSIERFYVAEFKNGNWVVAVTVREVYERWTTK